MSMIGKRSLVWMLAPAIVAADVRLPAGARIMAATYLHRAWTGQTAVTLYRVRHGQKPEALMHATSGVGGDTITPVALAPEAGADLVVRSKYRYFLSATVGEGSAVHGVTILYR